MSKKARKKTPTKPHVVTVTRSDDHDKLAALAVQSMQIKGRRVGLQVSGEVNPFQFALGLENALRQRLTINQASFSVSYRGKTVILGDIDAFKLLRCLVDHLGQAVSHEQLCAVLGPQNPVLKSKIRDLRKRLKGGLPMVADAIKSGRHCYRIDI